ncbi:leukocyte immunoglobulin-like receptor subfamily B member 3 isoform X2 [Myotis daubentonii]|uniref:leukocyte immunoglobulin-like receptor subfamily B member 3 isoform X2 n=1 Tax=Myotis daubentonii TaxID=98922 RepID=UPI002873ACD0|nr:leukocyte immunoglobulin-like receptor subfamily B member 3 isoform X2 [Myotis daubentonii]
MTPTLRVLLCLGLSVGLRTPVQAGPLPKPTLRAEPDPLIPQGSPVTITCQGTPGAEKYRLDKERNQAPWKTQNPQEPGDKASFSITHMTQHYAGIYRCLYHSPAGRSEPSDPLELVVTGSYNKPRLSALPSPVVTSGGNMTLRCGSGQQFGRYILTKEGDHRLSWTLDSQPQPSGQSQALFPVGPVTRSTKWIFRCYGCYRNSPQVCSHPSDALELLVSGDVPKPSIWADPGPIITKGSPVTIWCQGSLQASAYVLYEERGSNPLVIRIPQNSSNKAGFLIKAITKPHAGLYQCAYYTTGDILSEPSDPLLLVVTGVGHAPSLSAQPSPVVASGENVSLSCSSNLTSGPFHLLKEGGADPPRHMEAEPRAYDGRWRAIFPLGPVSPSHGGTYRCYGSSSDYPNAWSQPSAPLHIDITGVHREPALSAQPGSLVLPGHSLTLQCHAEAGFDTFALTKDEGLTHPQRLHGQHSPHFPLGHVNRTHGGRYRCYSGHSLSSVWSAPSAPLDILVAGMYRKPSLSAQPGPSVPRGATVTLQCGSEIWFDTFHLHREGSLDPPQHLRLQNTSAPSQANFTLSPVTSGHQGTYRCYGSNSTSPYLLSQPSDPLELVVSGLEWNLIILIGVSVALVLLLSLLLFLFLRFRHQSKGSTSADAAMKDPQPGESMELDPQNRQDEDPQGVTYAQVNHSTPRPRQGMATSPSSKSEELLDTKGRQAEEDRQMDSQAAPDAPQDVTYAQLNLLALRRQTSAPPSSPSEEPPEEPSLYAALATH